MKIILINYNFIDIQKKISSYEYKLNQRFCRCRKENIISANKYNYSKRVRLVENQHSTNYG